MRWKIGIGGLRKNIDAVRQQFRHCDDFQFIYRPGLLKQTRKYKLIQTVWTESSEVDLYYSIWYGQWLRYLIAKLQGKPVVCHWVGSDVLRVLNEPLYGWLFRHLVTRWIDKHLVVAPHLQDELKTLGINSAVVPLTSGLPSVECGPLPQQFTVLSYLPLANGSFYGAEVIYQLARDHPEWQFLVVGRGETTAGRQLENLQELGEDVDMSAVYPRISVLLRPTEHDGLSRMVLEALNWGRYVIFSQPFEHAFYASKPAEIEDALMECSTFKEPNIAGHKHVSVAYSDLAVVAGLSAIFRELLTSATPREQE